MKLIIHRGTKEIGGSCVEVIAGKTRILIDFGMPLVDENKLSFDEKKLENKSIAELKAMKVLPDITGVYNDEEKKIDAILLSHSHKDHYGLLKYVNPDIPVYISEGACKLIHVLNVFTHKQNHSNILKPCIVKHRIGFDIGGLHITPYLVDHSGFDAMSFLVEEKSTRKSLFYSGDFRASGWKKYLFDSFIKHPPKNVSCLLMEGTMIERQESSFSDEQAVLKGVQEVLKKNNNIVFAYCSGQNIDRIVTFYKAVRHMKATFIIDPYIAIVLHVVKNENKNIPQLDWRNIKVLIGNYYGNGDMYIEKIVKSNLKYLTFDIGKHKIKTWEIGSEKCLVVMRDSMIPLVKQIPKINGATVIYSQWEGYIRDKEKASKFWNFVDTNNLILKHIHTSGHAVVKDLKSFNKALRPKILIPIHTFHADQYKKLFDNVHILSDDELFEL
ncbi:MAG: MBL fold metallo-hydrolase [Candidatus Firestonebacteria bacterium]